MVLEDGYSTTITFSIAPAVSLWEKSVTPLALEGRGPIDTTTMRNQGFTTQVPKQLAKLGNLVFKAAFNSAMVPDILNNTLQVIQTITVNFPDGATFAFLGWLDEFKPDEFKEGEQPTATVTIIPSLEDPDTQVETDPVFVAAA